MSLYYIGGGKKIKAKDIYFTWSSGGRARKGRGESNNVNL